VSLPRLAIFDSPWVNIPVGPLIWVMIIPMLVKVDFSARLQLKVEESRGVQSRAANLLERMQVRNGSLVVGW